MKDFLTIADVLPLLAHDGDFIVYYNDLNEDFTRPIAAFGKWEDIRNAGIDSSEVAQIQFENNLIRIFLM